MAEDEVRVWDEHGQAQQEEDIQRWSSWQKCRDDKLFPSGLVQFLEDSVQGCGFPAPTPIQSHAWPVLIYGKDLIGVAKTGSGKTLAFLLPGFMWLRKNRKSQEPVDPKVGPAILVMTPTRELCNQIYTDADKFGKPVKISAGCVYGGAPKKDQEWALREGPETLIATPGRCNDFVNSSTLSLEMVRYCVLDEADRMLDMGFEPQIKEILDKVPEKRQMSMFTATWNHDIRKIADNYIKYPVYVQVGGDDVTTNQNIEQHIEVANTKEEKMAGLKAILEKLSSQGNCLVFCNKKATCRELAWELDDFNGLKVCEIHGDLEQWRRDESLSKFRSGEARVLVATDVAARGLDIRKVSTVVNYDAPNTSDDYIHRIGRTGRAGDLGDAYTFFQSWGEDKKAKEIKAIMERVGQTPPDVLEKLAEGSHPDPTTPGSSSGGGSSGGDNGWGGGSSSWGAKDEGPKDDKWGGGKDEWKQEGKDEWKKDDKWGGSKDDKWGGGKDEWKQEGKDEWKKDDKWGGSKDDKWGSGKDEWKQEGKDEWKKDEWKKEEWKKDEWKKDDNSLKKDEWKKDEWKKDESKEEWNKDEWKNDKWKDESKDANVDPGDDFVNKWMKEATEKDDGAAGGDKDEEDEAADADMAPAENHYGEAGGTSPSGKRKASEEPQLARPAKRQVSSVDLEAIEQVLAVGEAAQLSHQQLTDWLESKGLSTEGENEDLMERATAAAVDAEP